MALYEGGDFEYERTFTISDKFFSKSVVLGNRTSLNGSFVLLVFDHGNQVSFTLGDSEEVMTHYKFEIESEEYKNFEINLNGIEDGFHSITYMLMKDPDEIPENNEDAMLRSDLYSIRVNVLKNIADIPNERPFANKDQVLSESRTVHGPLISSEATPYEVVFDHEGIKDFQYRLYYGNSFSEKLDFYLVSLVDYEQTPINEKTFIYDELNADEEKYTDIQISSGHLSNKNIHQIIMITLPFDEVTKEEPYLLIDPLLSNRVRLSSINSN